MLSIIIIFLIAIFENTSCVNGLSKVASIITGSTGILGQSLVKACCSQGFHVIIGYRDSWKENELRKKVPDICLHSKSLFIDLSRPYEISSATFADLGLECFDKLVLYNNGGVCLHGSTFEALRDSLIINALSPISLAELVMKTFINKEVRVVNISSGEGELIFLHSKLQKELQGITTIQEWRSTLATHFSPQHFDSDLEYAYGDTPMYSVSKAYLNKASQLLHHTCLPHHHVLTTCPGNFLSLMSGPDDIEEVWEVQQVADMIVSMAMTDSSAKYSGDVFWRRGHVIPW